MKSLVKTEILGVGITNASSKSILEYVVDLILKTDKSCFIATPNPEMIVAAHKNPKLQQLLNRADLALCDGVGLFFAAGFMAKPLPERITGVDFMKSLCEKFAKKPITVGFLGGRPNVAEKTAKCLQEMYPGLNVVFAGDEWNEEGFQFSQGLKKEKNETLSGHKTSMQHIDVLFVAMGFPKQEHWIDEHLHKLPIRVAMGVGGAFDYLSGNVSRAPFILRSLGLEWLYRLIRQPWRFKRQIALLEFIWLVVKVKFSSSR